MNRSKGAADIAEYFVPSGRRAIPRPHLLFKIIELINKNMKTVGIIGGLGPETTSKFYLEIIQGCQQKNKQARPAILIFSVPMPFELEKSIIVKEEQDEEKILPILIQTARKLETAGVNFLVMPCNSLHAFIEEIRASVSIPVLSILEETTKFLQKEKIKQVGLLSTIITRRRKLYEDAFSKAGIESMLPSDSDQVKIGKIIHSLVMSQQDDKERKELIGIIENLEKRGAKHVVLACTDLQLLIPAHPGIKIFDTMKILARATVKKILNSEDRQSDDQI